MSSRRSRSAGTWIWNSAKRRCRSGRTRPSSTCVLKAGLDNGDGAQREELRAAVRPRPELAVAEERGEPRLDPHGQLVDVAEDDRAPARGVEKRPGMDHLDARAAARGRRSRLPAAPPLAGTPKSARSESAGSSARQSTATSGALPSCAEAWMARATRPRPVPGSPTSITPAGEAAALATCVSTSRMAGDSLTRPRGASASSGIMGRTKLRPVTYRTELRSCRPGLVIGGGRRCSRVSNGLQQVPILLSGGGCQGGNGV